ncbi:hypothetical protein HRbin01_00806 [archaeon HR01]|nr:hypothetical protein HRbin01_00806 [archaeon HR01]
MMRLSHRMAVITLITLDLTLLYLIIYFGFL